ncbi:GGDEF domain-containing protein [Paucibacter sp. DJ1R-11]|uniref:GGDEF domain-containing protein n=1 Tax=Paucibacter sp. DJ1R-11 TaxID=2893556 RepID=UPI0021E43323|nr:GGDEF domain-containing protein [Paucibacter sp. DJ1R-11]MCV2365653.1 GGDEF domain-containing protein [Paucibacter sp. DJ1R-11]
MKYQDSMSRSAEHLRAALPLMTRQRAALHPVSYAVWYEHVSGINPPLSRALHKLTQEGRSLDEAQTWQLYDAHVSDFNPKTAQTIGDGMARVLDSLSASTAQAGQCTAGFESSLQRWVQDVLADAALHPPSAEQDPAGVVRELLDSTREVRASLQHLQGRLDSSQNEIRLLRAEVQKARADALVDALTGLANRRAFEQQLSLCAASHRGPGSAADAAPDAGHTAPCLVLGDIDFFKRVNDSFGHLFGDHVLRAVAQTLKGVATHDSLPARVGGEEFALLLPRAQLAEARSVAEQMRASVAASRIRPAQTQAALERITISMGVTQMHPGESANDFFARADRALYASKRCGRNCVTVLSAQAA